MTATILVFGATGQLGSELAYQGSRRDVAIYSVTRDQGDIEKLDVVQNIISSISPSLVVNAAAYSNVEKAELHPDEAFRANAIGPGVLAQVCNAAQLPLIHISTDYVFDGTKPSPYKEDDSCAPLNVYGRSKLAGEAAIEHAHDLHIIMRTSWLFGLFGKNFVKTIMKLATERDELSVVIDQHGCPTCTVDLADAILSIAPRLLDRDNCWGLYHFSGPSATSWHDFAVEIVELQARKTHKRPFIVPVATTDFPTLAKRPLNSEMDSSLFESVFGIQAAPWRDRTRETVRALMDGGEHTK